ncbi:MAG: polysaccharide pyruvyl transferase family protein [Planctomycetaceae bacterium]|nr:polysaccharide pyruvyl transferase family protein [Planctomycetaceae bacterium]
MRTVAKRLLPGRAVSLIGTARRLSSLAWNDVQDNVIAKRFPQKPRAISFMANDICNSKCQMCLIWERKRDKELTPAELGGILAQPLFSHVADFGITGGEPTLRKDLPELFRTAIRSLPRLQSASTITNAIRERQVIDSVMESAEICRAAGVGFSVMVSLDGLGDVHDVVRGRRGNFKTAMTCIGAFTEAGIATSFGCTITKSNAADVDELMDFASERGLYGRFRVAEFIDRLYNAPQTEHIRSFDDRERYHLGLFFFRAEHAFEPHPTHRKTYRSIRGMLAEGKPRSTGCPYQSKNVVLTARGELLFCSPKSPIVGNLLEQPAEPVYFNNLPIRDEIREKHCDDCIHDYHVPETFQEKVSFYKEHRRRARKYDLARLTTEASRLPSGAPIVPTANASRDVLIVGWYGTETAGDKAILWSVIERLRRRASPPDRITVASFHPFVTERTKAEMEIPDVEVVETYTHAFERRCREIDEVVIGGGPLMHLDALDHMLHAFIEIRGRGGTARIDGCGLGPLVGEKYLAAVRELMRLSNHVSLRDDASAKWAGEGFSRSVESSCDPAVDYVDAVRAEVLAGAVTIPEVAPNDGFDVACFLREMTGEYAGSRSPSKFEELRRSVEQALVEVLDDLSAEKTVRLFPMHTFTIGNDDRVFARRLVRQVTEQAGADLRTIAASKLPTTPKELLAAMAASRRLSLCMRFHSVLFAECLGVPYLAIDYTQGGKIHAFLKERNRLDRLITLDELASGEAKSRILDAAFVSELRPGGLALGAETR